MSQRERVRVASWLAVVALLIFVGIFSAINIKSEDRGFIYYGLDIEGGIDLLLRAVPPEGSDTVREDQMRGLVSVLRNRIDPQGTKEITIQRVGTDRINIQVPGESDSSKYLDLIKRTARMEFWDTGNDGLDNMTTDEDGNRVPTIFTEEMREKYRSLEYKAPDGNLYPLTGDQFYQASISYQGASPVVAFQWKRDGAKAFYRHTSTHIGQYIAIVLDDVVISCPVINGAISGSGIIQGDFTIAEVQDLVIQLNSGSLPVQVEELENRTVGPTLGARSVEASKIAGFWGLMLVLLFMVIVYRFAGLAADLALVIYITLFIGFISTLGITLTLPGIAGFILSIGMAVDANVIIFERLKEELKTGKDFMSSIDAGFNRAITAIVDANVTTLITGFILYNMGTGPIKGFAVTLCIGILLSMFSAIVVTRLFLEEMFRSRRLRRPSLLGLPNDPEKLKAPPTMAIPIIPRRRIWYTLSCVVIGIGLLFSGINLAGDLNGSKRFPMKLGIDFAGGLILSYQVDDDFRNEVGLDDAMIGGIIDNHAGKKPVIQFTHDSAPGSSQLIIKMEAIDDVPAFERDFYTAIGQDVAVLATPGGSMPEAADDSADNATISAPEGTESTTAPEGAETAEATPAGVLLPGEKDSDNDGIPDIRKLEQQKVGAVIGSELTHKALWAVIYGALGILVYVWWRFSHLDFAVAAVVALVHDVLVLVGLFAIFRFEINSPFVAAILTVVGYSINDTIVVFDRVRENLKVNRGMAFKELAELSLHQTWRRSIYTSVTTMLVILTMIIFGGASIKTFMFALLVGVVSGTYSSLFTATPLLVTWRLKKTFELLQSREAKLQKKLETAKTGGDSLTIGADVSATVISSSSRREKRKSKGK